MKRPDCKSALFAVIFGVIGGVFLAVGLVLLSAGKGGLSALIFFEIGVLFLMAFGFCLMYADLLRRQWDKLRWKGTAVEGRVAETVRHTALHWMGQFPWSVLCTYQWEGKEYTVRSCLLWTQPRSAGTVTVKLDPQKPRRAWVDTESMRVEIEDRR